MEKEHISAQAMLQHLVETAMEKGNTGLTFVLAVCDENGIASTIHHSDLLEQAEPGHTERTLICLVGSFYNKHMVPDMNLQTFAFGPDGGEGETRQ